ncbi:MAG: undecaprenyl-diphosphate phosphatase [Lachnospiraceae bacterium]|jgi:undecaprenyl-diphosphatase|nr:undecaprenyl-diphosphate phosphatase [Lachnospiraceae bacterium]SFT62678.1 undecaprenyl-diphosphatase [Lachnospiraceae bacterium XBD2001]MBQ1640935.1 undecaprenyl-diphosphate phosphatase [Lachnospiraceae bacterium]MBQ1721437.1 undecaprenyl-diphosphate phosphatase [Lachnospiraceae bacterium]MBQ2466136.1 undecaprenyl-diphosphate phosphatase [Lachnospiraceae bacterium]
MLEILKAILFGIVEGVTEWLPISSTGHMILLNEIVSLNVSEEFYKMFEVVIQLGAIMAVVILYWNTLWPFTMKRVKAKGSVAVHNRVVWKEGALAMWIKIIIACIPAAIVGVLFDDKIDELFYHPIPVALALIIVGVIFIVVEFMNGKKEPVINSIAEIGYNTALIIGLFQLLAAIFPGTSRSGATIIGALLIGVSREVAAEFTFFLAVPVMFGASLLKVAKYVAEGVSMSGLEVLILIIGCVVAFAVSIFVIRFLMSYIKKHDFKVFGWYRIVLGILVIIILM